MAYSAIIKPSDYFNPLLYSGNATARSLTGVGFEPSWVWIKERTSGSAHMLFDQPRGVQKYISTNNTNAQTTTTVMLSAFGNDGFSLGNGDDVNDNGQTYVAWNWKANGQGSSNTDGSTNTIYTSASTTSGFSISTYTGSGGNATIGHGLGAVPKMIIIKSLANTTSWMVYSSVTGNNSELSLSSSAAASGSSTAWQDTDPTSSVFSVAGGAGDGVNASGDYVAYCFADVKGFSKIGSYTGNGNVDGTFVYTGFKPAYVLAKRTNGSYKWLISDNKRNPFNAVQQYLSAEYGDTDASGLDLDFLSNGFKLRTTSDQRNASGAPYLYMAFAESPFVANSGESIPTTAR